MATWLRVSALMQRYRTPLVLSTCSGLFGLNLSQHLVPDQTFWPLYQAWSKGEPVQLSERLETLFQKVQQDLGVPSSHRFTAFGFAPVGAGLPLLPQGGRVGLPLNFNSTDTQSTDTQSTDTQSTDTQSSGVTDRVLFMNGRALDWSSASGSALARALVLSEHAQKFAVARELVRLEGALPLLSAAVAPVCVGGVWLYATLLKQVFRLQGAHVLWRAAANTVALALGGVSYLLGADAVTHFIDFSCDRRAAAVSPLYAQGGVEFYDKILSRNRTLRDLMGPKGLDTYAANGNLFPSNVLQLKHTPYTARREALYRLVQDPVQ
ncbi:unnamed protein product [Knipowitschia caucasica]